MANLFHAVFNGNLTADATFKKFSEEKGVINFTVAHNFPTSKKTKREKLFMKPNFITVVDGLTLANPQPF